VFCFAPLYTKYIPKKKEYRVHVIDNEVLLIQEKRKRRGQEADAKVRSHANGWVFCFNDIVVPEDLCLVALAAVEAVGHGGAVDIVWNERVGKCFALEVNSAPGLCPKSASIYAERIIRATSE
jgi:hypothetical protein